MLCMSHVRILQCMRSSQWITGRATGGVHFFHACVVQIDITPTRIHTSEGLGGLVHDQLSRRNASHYYSS